MIWFLESHSFLVAVSASFLLGILLDMLLKKLTGSEKIGYVAGSAAGVTPGFPHRHVCAVTSGVFHRRIYRSLWNDFTRTCLYFNGAGAFICGRV